MPSAMLGDVIREKRLAKGLTQQQLAVLVGVTVGTVARWENAAHPRPPRLKQRRALRRVLGLTDEEAGL